MITIKRRDPEAEHRQAKYEEAKPYVITWVVLMAFASAMLSSAIPMNWLALNIGADLLVLIVCMLYVEW